MTVAQKQPDPLPAEKRPAPGPKPTEPRGCYERVRAACASAGATGSTAHSVATGKGTVDINERGAISIEDYENAQMAAKFAMTNEELANAIDVAARHSYTSFGHGKREHIMLDHLQKLLELQLRRAAIVKIGEPD